MLSSSQVPGFRPSLCGLHFANCFPAQPVLTVAVPGLGTVPLGDASRGLCGGLAFAARDFFEAGRPVPAQRHPPPLDAPMYRYLVRRLFASFNLPRGPLRYYHWMNLPDEARWHTRGVWWRTVHREWPRIRAELDAGRLAALGLVKLRTADPFQMGENHQVLAHGYRLDGSRAATLFIYDPNYPDNDGITLTLDLLRPARPLESTGGVVRGFFLTPYRRARLPRGIEVW